MKPRRLNRWRYKNRFARAAQRVRLGRIADGVLEPADDRERCFLWTLQRCGRADPEDFTLPGLLFWAERVVGARIFTKP